MKRVYSGVVAAGLCLAMMGSFTGCGEVKAYKTEHEFSDLNISSIKKLFFEDKCSPEKIGRKIPDFCLYEDGDEYEATGNVHIKVNNEYIANFKMTIYFNADKEFECWHLKDFSFDEIQEDKLFYKNTYYFLKDELGEPIDDDDKWGSWDDIWEVDGYILESETSRVIGYKSDEND